jgi:Cys-rich four helix bundle protein (predicted Tat secretion target)
MEERGSNGISLGRRELVIGAAALAAVASVSRTADAAAEPKKAGSAELAALAGTCVQKGEECISHCLALFASGDTSLASCAKAVHEMTAVCSALERLAHADSTHLRTLAPACSEICAACEKECEKHAKEHEICASCGKACKELIAALQPLLKA